MFGGRFSQTPYSRGGETAEITIYGLFVSSLNAAAGSGRNILIDRVAGSSLLQGAAFPSAGIPEEGELSASLRAELTAAGALLESGSLSGTLAARAVLSADLYTAGTRGGILLSQIYAGRDIWAAARALAALNGKTAAAEDLHHPPALLAALLNCHADSAVLETLLAVLDVTIPPGGELRIDSGAFTALLDGENVLHAYSGDWVRMERALRRLVLDSGSGGALAGRLVFQERYL